MDKILYPSSIWYNMGVDGFLRVLSYGFGNDFVESNILKSDGTVYLSDEIQKIIFSNDYVSTDYKVLSYSEPEEKHVWRLTRWYSELSKSTLKDKKKKDSDVLRSLFASNKTRYPNMFPGRERMGEAIIKAFQDLWVSPPKNDILDSLHCSLCGKEFVPYDIDFDKNLLTASALPETGSFPSAFPNTFWNLQPQEYVCGFCRNMLLFRHLNLYGKEAVFINTPSFEKNYFLNRAFYSIKEFEWADLLGTVLKFNQILGIWSLSGIEIAKKTYYGVNLYPFPRHVASVFILPNALSLMAKISKLPEKKYGLIPTMDIIMSGNYSELLSNAYKLIRAEDSKYSHEKGILAYLELFIEIKSGGTKMDHLYSLSEVREKTKTITSSIQNDLFKNRFRLLERARMGDRPEIQYLITRIFIANKKPVPDFLVRIFEEEDDEIFKAKMFAFLGSLEEKPEE